MKSWFKRLGWFSRKERTYEEDELSLFFDETLPGEPEAPTRANGDASAKARTNKAKQGAKSH